MLDGYDLVQFVTGTPPWMCAAANVKRPKFLWTATTTRADRSSRLQKANPLRRLWLSLMTQVAEKYEQRGLRIASGLFALSDYTLASIHRIPGSKSGIVAACGVDTDFFHPAPAATKKYIVCVGRLDDPRKNISLLLDAYARVRRKMPSAPELLLVGPPIPAATLQWIRKHDLAGVVRLVGPRKPSELPEIYQSALCFALSSDEEGLGIVLLEAMACGVPVASTACGGPDTVIDNERTGFLTPPGDANALAEKLLVLLENPELAERMGEQARKACVERFSMRSAGHVFIQHYEQTLSSPDLNRTPLQIARV
jgi:glycosyltransferase involved in cell wall biosynthesis